MQVHAYKSEKDKQSLITVCMQIPDNTVEIDLAEFGNVTLPDCLEPSCPLIENNVMYMYI